MSITRTTLLAGPAAVTYNGHTFFADHGILVTPALELNEVDSDANGVLDDTVFQTPMMIRFIPSASMTDLLVLYPHLQAEPGVSLFGPSDTPLVLTAANGVRLTFAAVALVGMPDLLLGPRGSVAGTVTFLALGARSLALTAGNRLVTIDTGSIPLPTRGTPQLADDFAITWGTVPWVTLRARDGVRVHFTLKTKPVLSDADAWWDVTLERLEIEVRFTPATPSGPDEADVFAALAMQGPGSWPGRALSATAQALDLAGDSLFVRLPAAQLVRADLAFEAIRPRIGELIFKAERALMAEAEPLALVSEGLPV